MKDKKIYIIVASLAVLLLIVVLAFIIFPIRKSKPLPLAPVVYQPEFLNVNEKQALGLPADSKIQALGRDSAGGVTVYKIIKSDSDIVSNPSKVGSISPRQK